MFFMAILKDLAEDITKEIIDEYDKVFEISKRDGITHRKCALQ